MAEQEQRRPTRGEKESAEPVDVGPAQSVSRGSERLKGELDDLLDEIDEVLESNAEEFVKSYIQKGGE
ncbi:MAG: ubiquitin-like protein Pup [Acidimicrobiales bacterium]|jgi:ubiquitin-like protein Pup|nr:ubiquitin-like protein Pup [Acidimicrobiaceae bacterium]MDP6078383.1 ubiquitin-like protein Pup [Acidimicrobiales bacterium]HCV36321.1 ubiquitin-like protein Pup [Acidimicrobiaceae bacterium]HJO79606.1 ubiquitin-like protein Pup [Acidimicrobiales bacterium]|tara:strand:+ start:6080 stop:6283 length:204 start_codon:yes stop_codon:yes gene_type:complete